MRAFDTARHNPGITWIRAIATHSFRATGSTTYLQNGGKLEIA
jgi:hypothetical protein